MTGIKVTLSNGEQSPYFKGTQRQTGPVTLSLDQKETPHKITMETSPWACTGFTVQDKQGKDLCKWIGLKNDSGTIEIPEGQNIVGIYGSTSGDILNFGFLTANF